jgi:predicted ATP-dependent serine protease
MRIFYECNVCCFESGIKTDKCPQCEIGDMIEMTVIRKDVLDKLKADLDNYKKRAS